MRNQKILVLIIAGLFIFFSGCKNETKYRTLLITGQSNHNWKASYPILKTMLDETGLFSTEVAITPEKGGDMNLFKPDFSKYKLVVLDYNGDAWSESTRKGFIDFVSGGGGVVVYHSSCMAFPDWKEYNEITGLGGWGGRNEKAGPYVYYKNNKLVSDTTAGISGSHGKRLEFELRIRKSDHPVTRDLPVRWMHGNDELYSRLRGPARNMEILATAYADTTEGGTGRDEPLLMAITYGNGRVFNTALGHADEGGGPAMHCTGFIVTFQRGAEWAATGNVTQAVPNDFPNEAGVVLRPDYKELTLKDDLTNIGNYNIAKSTRYFSDLQGRIRKAAGDAATLLKYEKMMVDILKNKEATVDSKKLILRELSWMGTDYCAPSIKALLTDTDLKEEAEFALERLKMGK
jgi:type 1 glutamine amidotransferase